MKLHCKICSCGGTHLSTDSEIGTINDNIGLPLTPEMFSSLNPEREIPAPWRAGVDWQTMKCPRGPHLPWGVEHSDIEQAMKAGGPHELLTESGMLNITKPVTPANQMFTCDKCGRTIKSKLGFNSHYKACK